MSFKFGDLEMRQDVRDFLLEIQAIDVEKVEENTVRRAAVEMSDMVRQAVIAEPEITTPAMNSVFERGDGPSMATEDAWIVSKTGTSRYSVKPHPKVKQRAYVLNFGYPGKITPTNAEALRFTIDGIPVFRTEVQGPDATHYWAKAVQRMKNSDKLQKIGSEELQEEVEENV